MPDGSRILSQWQAQLAAEEAINKWVKVSEGAMELFMKQNLKRVWDRYDNFKKGEIELRDGPVFIRELMESMAPPEKEEVNPYEEAVERQYPSPKPKADTAAVKMMKNTVDKVKKDSVDDETRETMQEAIQAANDKQVRDKAAKAADEADEQEAKPKKTSKKAQTTDESEAGES